MYEAQSIFFSPCFEPSAYSCLNCRDPVGTLRGAITAVDFEFTTGKSPNNRAPGPVGLPNELLR